MKYESHFIEEAGLPDCFSVSFSDWHYCNLQDLKETQFTPPTKAHALDVQGVSGIAQWRERRVELLSKIINKRVASCKFGVTTGCKFFQVLN